MTMKTLVLSVVAIASTVFVPGMAAAAPAAEEVTPEQWGSVLNLSGRQRMLTQKMSKEALLVAAGVDADANRENLGKTMAMFETTLAGLRDGDESVNLPGTANGRIVKQLDEVKTLYGEIEPIFRSIVGGATPGGTEIATIAAKNPPLLVEMNKAVKMYERESQKVLVGSGDLAVVINLSGKQRMLTQKMSKEFLLVYLGVNVDENRLNVRETSSLFDRTLKGLLDGDTDLELPGTTEQSIRDQLAKVGELWTAFYPVVSKAGDSGVTLTEADVEVVAQKNLPLLKNMNEAVQMYEKLAKGESFAHGGE
ncbi:MAG: type IV pili methyl-accepting chemotaxis transducer N-terminal domain-containing protein [Phycisphaeraceae bacterium]|nr:MAG: type IV pili methyl-accepting chemotaxis transducer N-terminal domain-containing protein [Phycisphaeraceae bacterium]